MLRAPGGAGGCPFLAVTAVALFGFLCVNAVTLCNEQHVPGMAMGLVGTGCVKFLWLVWSWDAPSLDFGAVATTLSRPEPPVAAAWGSSAQIKTKLSFQRI